MNATALQRGAEQYERFHSCISHRDLIQYDYRDRDGELFSTVAPDLDTAKQYRDAWLDAKSIADYQDLTDPRD